jgi:hypothetical protein
MNELARSLGAIIRAHIQAYNLTVDRNDLLVVFDQLTGRFAITFEVNQPVAVQQAAE